MRPLFHPPVEDITVEGILYALSDPVRARIFMEIVASECGQKCSAFANLGGKALAKSTLSQHFRILREAGLIRSERNGVQLSNTLRWEELPKRLTDLIEAIIDAYAHQIKKQKS